MRQQYFQGDIGFSFEVSFTKGTLRFLHNVHYNIMIKMKKEQLILLERSKGWNL